MSLAWLDLDVSRDQTRATRLCDQSRLLSYSHKCTAPTAPTCAPALSELMNVYWNHYPGENLVRGIVGRDKNCAYIEPLSSPLAMD